MSRGIDLYRRPELILADLIQRAARGEDRERRVYYRATVLAVDLEGGKLQNKSGTGSVDVRIASGQTRTYRAVPGPDNPRGSIKARVLTDGLDRLLSDDDVRVFWPMFPHDQIALPISPGEHVYVVFEGNGMDHGLWISRVSGQDSANSFQGVKSYTAITSHQHSAMETFEPSSPDYQRTDEYAGLATPRSAMTSFEED